MFGRIGIPELILILVIALIVFGPAKLPQIGKSIGQAIREFRKSTTGIENEIKEVTGSLDPTPAVPPPQQATPMAAVAPPAATAAPTAAPVAAQEAVEG